MKLITNIQPPFLSDILFKQLTKCKKIKASVAYCSNYELFEYCKKNKIKLDYYGRLDDTINLELQNLKKFLTDDISIHIIAGDNFHPKVIWCDGYGAYIGSANLTKSAWEENIECGLWLDQKELENNLLNNSLEDFFKFIKKVSKPLNNISEQDILKLKKTKEKMSQQNKKNVSLKSDSSNIMKKYGIFYGCKKENDLNTKSQFKKDKKNSKINEKFYTPEAKENFYFFKRLKKNLEKRREMSGLKVSEPRGGPHCHNSIEINLQPIRYKNHIKAYRLFRKRGNIIAVYYGFQETDKEYYEKLKNGKMSQLIKKGYFETEGDGNFPLGFRTETGRGNERADNQWIVDRIIFLLKALRKSK